MIETTSFSSAVRARAVLGWASIIWFTSAFSMGGQSVELEVTPEASAQCGKNLTLSCDAWSSQMLEIRLFDWLAMNQTVCSCKNKKPDPQVLCQCTEENSHHWLNLTLINVMPANEGQYLCKLRSTLGVKSATTNVKVQDCLQSSRSFINTSHAVCWFSGVNPNSDVHWFQGDVNLTDSASTQEEEAQHGQYNVLSSIDVQKGNSTQPYNCSLWTPDDGTYLTSQQLRVKKSRSSASVLNLQWLCIVVAIMVVKSVV